MGIATLSIGGARLVADVTGEGACVILLHAGVADRRMWRTTCEALSGKFKCIAYDRRGFGDSTSPDETFRSIDDLDAMIRHFGCERAHLIGSSQGGRIAIDYALARPENVLSLVLVAPALTGASVPSSYPPAIQRLMHELEQAEEKADLEKMNAIEAWMWLDGPLSSEIRVVGSARELFLDMNGRALRHAPLSREHPAPSATEQLHRLSHPAFVIWGDADFPYIKDRSRLIANTIPRGRHFVMEDCAHLPNMERPRQFDAAVLEFLTGLPYRPFVHTGIRGTVAAESESSC
jgi:pimeloyl-ACP methyl ester carboxylesterase